MSEKKEVEDKAKKSTKTSAKKVSQSSTRTKRRVNAKTVKDLDVKKGPAITPSATVEKISEVDFEKVQLKTVGEVLPEDYTPVHTKYGINAGYVSIPGRVFDFIIEQPEDWYVKIDEYPYYGDNDFFLSLMYYIHKEGFVNVQNLQTNVFYRLTLDKSSITNEEE